MDMEAAVFLPTSNSPVTLGSQRGPTAAQKQGSTLHSRERLQDGSQACCTSSCAGSTSAWRKAVAGYGLSSVGRMKYGKFPTPVLERPVLKEVNDLLASAIIHQERLDMMLRDVV